MSFSNTQQEPILVLDTQRCKRNINRMAERALKAGCIFRPHFKTHQSNTIGRWFRDEGVKGITVSSVSMAKYFIEGGWNDITIAFPFFPQQLKGLKEIEKAASLRLFVNSVEDLKLLNQQLSNPFKFFIEIDPGAGRSGVSYENTELISQLIDTSLNQSKSRFHGFYIHDGRTYSARSVEQIQQKINPTIDILVELKNSFPMANISMGDTPSASTSNRLDELDEMTPGNFAFYDFMQVQIGSCSLDDVALYAVLPIAQKIPTPGRTIVHGGAVHLSKEFLQYNDQNNFGQIVHYSANNDISETDLSISAISQEHGTIRGIPDDDSYVWVCPIHSCLTANLYDQYSTKDGKSIEKRILS
ncbi:MAG: alanine racemase [Balneolaceae bacterium]|nr:alanine racemase [Balneolaceae bacterium]